MLPQLTIPGLQRVASRACVACGAGADAFCSRCGVVPYCSARCQKTDWVARHKSVCHNLARLNEELEEKKKEIEHVVPAAKPLRQPNGAENRDPRQDDDTNESKKYSPRNSLPPNQNKPRFNGRNNANRRPGTQRQEQTRDMDEEESFEPKVTKPVVTETKREQSRFSRFTQNQQKQTMQEPKQTVSEPKQKSATKPETKPEPAQPEPTPSEVKRSNLKAPGSLTDATPGRIFVPKKFFVETLSIGDVALLTVEAQGSECRTKRPGLVCVSLHESGGADYQRLCDEYSEDCEKDPQTITPTPGEIFSFRNSEDGAWYRARCLTPKQAALIDSCKLVTIDPTTSKKLPYKYEAIAEFCCQLDAKGVNIGDSLKCTLVSKQVDVYTVSLSHSETGAALGNGELFRWIPEVECPAPTPVAIAIPEVTRPALTHNSKVFLVEASSLDRVFVRPSDVASTRRYDSILHDVLLYGRNATPLKEAPRMGDTVVGKFTDGNHYRALCKRTSVKQNKYLLEYIEYGNIEKSTLESLYPCPQEYNTSAQPTVVSLVTLPVSLPLTAAATEYLEKLRDECIELVLSIPDGSKTTPSGSAVSLAVAKNNESVNKKLEQMCTPEWKKVEQSGGDIIDTVSVMFGDIEYLQLPTEGGQLTVLDVSTLASGSVSVCPAGHPHVGHVLTTLTQQIADYCASELGREPYLPKHEEMCIAQCPPYPQWFRAVMVNMENGPGSDTARVCYVDYGNLETVPVSLLRKMQPEFIRGEPVLASLVEIEGFPLEKNLTPDMLTKALEHLQMNDEGQGVLQVTSCESVESGFYKVRAPDLLKAMGL